MVALLPAPGPFIVFAASFAVASMVCGAVFAIRKDAIQALEKVWGVGVDARFLMPELEAAIRIAFWAHAVAILAPLWITQLLLVGRLYWQASSGTVALEGKGVFALDSTVLFLMLFAPVGIVIATLGTGKRIDSICALYAGMLGSPSRKEKRQDADPAGDGSPLKPSQPVSPDAAAAPAGPETRPSGH